MRLCKCECETNYDIVTFSDHNSKLDCLEHCVSFEHATTFANSGRRTHKGVNTNAGERGGAVTYTACMIKCFKIIKKVDFITMLLVLYSP